MLADLGPAACPVLGPDDSGQEDVRGIVDPLACKQVFVVAHDPDGAELTSIAPKGVSYLFGVKVQGASGPGSLRAGTLPRGSP